jgi:hypothetical protein
MSTVGAPGSHGDVVAGMQGIGVKTPAAAAVAEATWGLAGELHTPNVGMFTSGLKSMTVAAGRPSTITRAAGSTTSTAGAAPNVHASCAPATTCCGIFLHSLIDYDGDCL